MLSKEERERYDRQILIKGFGEEGQARLKKAKVFIAGAGGLGSVTARILPFPLNARIFPWIGLGSTKQIFRSRRPRLECIPTPIIALFLKASLGKALLSWISFITPLRQSF